MADLNINPPSELKKITNFLVSSVKKTPFDDIIIGLSGGIDSSVSTLLAKKAIGVEHIKILRLPYGDFYPKAIVLSQQLIDFAMIPAGNVFTIDIAPIVENVVSLDKNMDKVRIGNIMARIRMVALFDLAKKYNCVVLGTENKTESLLGYFTRFGDEASDIEPIKHLYKTQVRELARFFNIPKNIIDEPPTASLWPGQTDEGDFDFSYEVGDQILYLYCDKRLKKEEIIKLGFYKETVEKVIKRVEENKFKHLLPMTLK